jgi:hypothetical protein
MRRSLSQGRRLREGNDILKFTWATGGSCQNSPNLPATGIQSINTKPDSESRCLLDVMFETLKRILLPDRESQKSALHG